MFLKKATQTSPNLDSHVATKQELGVFEDKIKGLQNELENFSIQHLLVVLTRLGLILLARILHIGSEVHRSTINVILTLSYI